MKYLMIAITFLTVSFTHGQTLKENKVDEFTKNTVKRTSWEPIAKTTSIYGHVRGSKINNIYYLDLRSMFNGGEVVGIKEGPVVMFKMNTDSILTFNNLKHTVACKGCGAINIIGSDGYGVELNIPLTNEQIDYLTNNKITKIRIYNKIQHKSD